MLGFIFNSDCIKRQFTIASSNINILSGGQHLERPNVERPIFRNFEISNIKITKVELFEFSIFEFIF